MCHFSTHSSPPFFLSFSCLSVCPGFELSHCDDPGVPQFGFKISDQGHFSGSAVTFGCDQGYTLHGSSVLKCMTGERRAWDNHLPSCIGNPLVSVCLLAHLSFSPPLFVAYFIILNRHAVSIAHLGVNPKDLSQHDFYLIELC